MTNPTDKPPSAEEVAMRVAALVLPDGIGGHHIFCNYVSRPMCDLCNRLRHNERKGTSAMLAALQAERERLALALAAAEERARVDAQDARRWRFLEHTMSCYNVDADYDVEGHNVPALAQVSDRIWYHATDDITHPTLAETIDAAIASEKGEKL